MCPTITTIAPRPRMPSISMKRTASPRTGAERAGAVASDADIGGLLLGGRLGAVSLWPEVSKLAGPPDGLGG